MLNTNISTLNPHKLEYTNIVRGKFLQFESFYKNYSVNLKKYVLVLSFIGVSMKNS
jgi:hypothetical protein